MTRKDLFVLARYMGRTKPLGFSLSRFQFPKLDSLVSAVLAVFPCLEGDLAVAILDAEVGGVVARLD